MTKTHIEYSYQNDGFAIDVIEPVQNVTVVNDHGRAKLLIWDAESGTYEIIHPVEPYSYFRQELTGRASPALRSGRQGDHLDRRELQAAVDHGAVVLREITPESPD